jgi:Arc/MetJ family transcription regulator
VFFKGLLGGNGTRAAPFTTAAQVSATDKAVTTATLQYILLSSKQRAYCRLYRVYFSWWSSEGHFLWHA